MVKLNEKNERTEKIIHIVITNKCNRKCPDCCNNQYDMKKIPVVTDEEMKNAETILLTGGEPFVYGDPCGIAAYIRSTYPNIKNIYVYTNAFELSIYLMEKKMILYAIDGVTISIKNKLDYTSFVNNVKDNHAIKRLKSNWIYTFPGYSSVPYSEKHFTKKDRVWQKEFIPDPNSIFRRWSKEI